MKSVVMWCLMLLMALKMNGQAQTTLVKSIVLDGANVASIELPGNAKVSEWDKDYIRLTANIELMNNSEEILKKLVSVGRYDFKTALTNGTITINMPKTAHVVTIKGVDLIEKLNFEIQVPKGFSAQIKKTDISGVAPSL